jgi:hypothetical protein
LGGFLLGVDGGDEEEIGDLGGKGFAFVCGSGGVSFETVFVAVIDLVLMKKDVKIEEWTLRDGNALVRKEAGEKVKVAIL